jgi:glutathione peroxidase
MTHSIYDFRAATLQGTDKPLSDFKGQVVLIVNTASKCGFTPQYKGLETIYKQYQDQGLVVLEFPCNQFQKQEPGTDEEIQQFCELNFGVTFPLYSKIEVNGADAHPLFQYLTEALPGLLGTKAVKWNFTKFLIDREGKPIKRFAPKTAPDKIVADIEALL